MNLSNIPRKKSMSFAAQKPDNRQSVGLCLKLLMSESH